MKSDRVYCEQIVDSIEKIRKFVMGIDKKSFFKDQKKVLIKKTTRELSLPGPQSFVIRRMSWRP